MNTKRILYMTTPKGTDVDQEDLETYDLRDYATALADAQTKGLDLHAVVVQVCSTYQVPTGGDLERQSDTPLFEVVNPGGHVIVEADLPPHTGLFTNSSGYCASPAVIEEARRRGIELVTGEGEGGIQGLSICRMDACVDVPPHFDDDAATLLLVQQGFTVVRLPDCLTDEEAAESDIQRLDNGEFPSRFYAVLSYTPPDEGV